MIGMENWTWGTTEPMDAQVERTAEMAEATDEPTGKGAAPVCAHLALAEVL